MEHAGRSRAWMLVVGLIVGALVVPRVASAVGSVVTIQGGGGTQKAGVTKGRQLQTAEAAPSSFRVYEANLTETDCTVVTTVPVSSGYPNGVCSGDQVLAAAPTGAADVFTMPIEPGFGVAPGKKISVKVANSVGVAVSVFGYFVPPGDVPNTTPIAF
jgi:hypothetical protein